MDGGVGLSENGTLGSGKRPYGGRRKTISEIWERERERRGAGYKVAN